MAEADAPIWGFGLPPMKINPVSASFIKYFSICDSTTKQDSASVDTNNMSWSSSLAAPIPHTRLPAWSRVAIQPHASTPFTGLIMKRVGLNTRRPAVSATPATKPSAEEASPEPEVDEEDARRIRMRTFKYEASSEEIQFEGRPCTRAEMASVLMQAKVHVSNNFMANSSSTTLEEKRQCRDGTFVQVVPAKRYFSSVAPERIDAVGGNKLPLYKEVMPIIIRAMRNGMDEVDLTTASIAEASSIMRDIRRDVRQRVAAYGVPDLSDIADVAEPESPHTIKPPTIKAEWRSPKKRLAKLTSPIKNGFHRFTSNIVKLVPGSSPKAEPSPTKSDSAPSTPLRLSPAPSKALSSPGNSSPLSRSALDVPEHFSIDDSPPRAGRTFRAPSYCGDSSTLTPSVSHVSAANEGFSPIKYTRPVAPTPSRWNRREPATPQIFTPIQAPVTPGYSDSPIGLAALVPPATPQMSACPYTSGTPADTEFRFGDMSPSFNSIPWINTAVQASEPRRIQSVNLARRRQSEPLLRKHLETQARRKSSSPRKVKFQEDDHFFNTSTPRSDAIVEEPEGTKVDGQQELPQISTPTSSSQTHAPTMEHGVLNIDMRQNPDIFGAQLSSSPIAVHQLAQMAGNGCSGNANVVVKEENGRLFVRFKLPVEYANLFPESQCFDESHFTATPSAISSSPRINFHAQHSPVDRTPPSATRRPSARKAPIMSSAPVLEQSPTMNSPSVAEATPRARTPIAQTPEALQVAKATSPVFINWPASAQPLSPLPPTPKRQETDGTPGKVADSTTPTVTPQQPTSVTNDPTSSGSLSSDKLPADGTPSAKPSLTTSFTPVNRTSPRNKAATPSGDSARKSAAATTTPPADSEPVASVAIKQSVYDDSPGRDYMRDFIKRSRRTSTTDAGSPMAPTNKRQPLVAKSPNTPSPHKKRKLEKGDDAPSPLEKANEPKEPKEPNEPKESKETKEPAPKRVRRTIKAPKQKALPENDMDDELAPTPQKIVVEQPAHDDDQDELAMDNAEDPLTTRRSSRLRTQTRDSSAPRSSIPTSIKIGRSGAGRGTVLNSTVRSDQQELTAQTRMNTKKNKGDAEYPAQVLARVAEAAKSDESDASDAAYHSDSSKGRKSVIWKEPLEDVQGDKPKRGRPPSKAKPTQGKTGIAKPKSTSETKRTSKLAETLGMVANGTPRPQRVTRARTRSQA